LRQLAGRYPDVEIDVKPALEVADIMVVDLERGPEFPSIQLVMAEGSAISTAIVGRYTFDGLPTGELLEFLASLYESRFTLRARRFPLRVLSITVSFNENSEGVVARYLPGDLDQWEVEALARQP
jgi:hypothetical protein